MTIKINVEGSTVEYVVPKYIVIEANTALTIKISVEGSKSKFVCPKICFNFAKINKINVEQVSE